MLMTTYLRGLYYWNQRTAPALKAALLHFQEAAEKDSDSAAAFAALSNTYNVLPSYSDFPHKEAQLEAQLRATEAANKALQLDVKLPEGHAALGLIHQNAWNFLDGERELRTAIELNPNYAPAHQWYAEDLIEMNRFDEAMTEIRLSRELDPLSRVSAALPGFISFFARRYDDAIRYETEAAKQFPDFGRAFMILAWAYTEKARYQDAIAAYEKWRTLDYHGHGYSRNLPIFTLAPDNARWH
jgi:tetratricopeptide (TPR) repeat protein